jgi:hypothetical protein
MASQLPTLKARRILQGKKLFKDTCQPRHKLHHLVPEVRPTNRKLRKQQQIKRPKIKTKQADGALVNRFL